METWTEEKNEWIKRKKMKPKAPRPGLECINSLAPKSKPPQAPKSLRAKPSLGTTIYHLKLPTVYYSVKAHS